MAWRRVPPFSVGGGVSATAAGDRPGHARGADDAVHRPPLRRRLLRRRRGRGATLLRAPRLLLLHRRLPARAGVRRRRDLRRPADLRAQAALQPPAPSSSRCAVAVLGLLAWMQNMYIAPLSFGCRYAAMAFALALVVPIGVIFYNWIATIWDGALELRAALVRARRDRDHDLRAGRRARLLGDPGRLVARLHDRRQGGHRSTCWSAARDGRLRGPALLVPEAHRPPDRRGASARRRWR